MKQMKESNRRNYRKSESHFDELEMKSNCLPTFTKLNFSRQNIKFWYVNDKQV